MADQSEARPLSEIVEDLRTAFAERDAALSTLLKRAGYGDYLAQRTFEIDRGGAILKVYELTAELMPQLVALAAHEEQSDAH